MFLGVIPLSLLASCTLSFMLLQVSFPKAVTAKLKVMIITIELKIALLIFPLINFGKFIVSLIILDAQIA